MTQDKDYQTSAKALAARNLWVPAVNNAGTWGRLAFIEIPDQWDAKNTIRATLQLEIKA